MAHVSLKGQWLLVNQKLCEITGYTEDEMLGLTFQDLTHPDDLERDVTYIQKLISGEVQNYCIQKRYLRKDRTVVWINLTVSLVRDPAGQPLHFIGVVEDITDRKITEGKLQSLQAQMAQTIETELQRRIQAENERNNFFDLSEDLMAVFGFDGLLKFANPAFQNLFGYSVEELRARPFIEFIHPEDLDRTRAVSLEFRETGILPTIENRYIRKNGEITLLSWSATLVREESRIYVVARDVTELRKQERIFAEQQKLAAENSKMQALGKMAANIAHELNNPLTIVYGQTSFLKKLAESSAPDRAKLQSIAESMSATCRRMISILGGLRTFSRDGKNDPLEFYSLRKIVTETLSFCGEKIEREGIELQIDSIPDSCELYCRPVQISQVLLNLLNNACEATKATEKRWIHIELVRSASEVGLAVSDGGSGVKVEQVDHLFQPFFTTKPVGSGTGLGLSISKSILNSHGGKIYFDQQSPVTRFVFTLPAVTT